MSENDPRSERFVLRASDMPYLGLAGLAASLSVLTENRGPFASALADQSLAHRYLVALLLTATLVSVAAWLLSRRGAFSRKGLVVAAALLGAAGPLLAMAAGAPDQRTLVIAAGILAGVGNGLLGLAWGRAYAALDAEQIIAYSALSIGAAAVLAYAIRLVSATDARLAVIAALPIASALALWPLLSRQVPEREPAEPAAVIFSGVVRDVWRPVVGASLCALIGGLTWDAVSAGVGRAASWQDNVRLGSTVLLAAGLTVALLRGRRKVNAVLLYRVALPIASAVLLVIPFIDWDTVAWHAVSGVASSFGFSFFEITAWAALATAVRTSGLGAAAIFGPGRALLLGMMAVGLLAFPVVGLGGQVVCLLLITLYLVAMTLSAPNRERQPTPVRADLESVLTARCAALSRRHGLSQREAEIFTFLGRGHSPVYIARELGISENTVRTHVRRIHDKLGIHSREELIALIDAADSPETPNPPSRETL